MSSDEKQELATLYVLGTLDRQERLEVERAIPLDPELALLVRQLQETVAAMAVADSGLAGTAKPSRQVKERLLAQLDSLCQADVSAPDLLEQVLCREGESLVITDPAGLVAWVSNSFTEMCGYPIAELKGKKLGPLLQGEKTDPQGVQEFRRAIRDRRAFTGELVNYHKLGRPYWVSISITPVLDGAGSARGFLALEREMPERAIG